jgi:hypothetical protein
VLDDGPADPFLLLESGPLEGEAESEEREREEVLVP